MFWFVLVVSVAGYASAQEIQSRIYGGVSITNSAEFPYIVSIQKNGEHICGGSILNKYSVVTATHCVINETGLRIMAGSATLGFNPNAQFVDVVQVLIHPNYRPGDPSGHDTHEELSQNDIAVLKLKQPLKFCNTTKCIQIICGKEMNEAIQNEEIAKVQGWGSTDTAIIPRFLQEIEVPIWSNKKCHQDIPPTCHPAFDTTQQFCTGPPKPSDLFRGAGMRDDGGPLTVRSKIAGIILHGKHEDEEQCHVSTIYTKIAYFKDFLVKAAGPQDECKGKDAYA